MIEGSEFNKLILDTIDEYCTDSDVRELIQQSLQYELDIWNRHIRSSEILDEYERIIENIIRGRI